jgi:cyclopropane-fatty-acyl-phospholipid synthase
MVTIETQETQYERSHTTRVAAPLPGATSRKTREHQTLRIIQDLFGPAAQRPFALRLWDGSVQYARRGREPDFTLELKSPDALRRMLLPSELALGEAYLRDDFDIEGDIEAASALADMLAARFSSPLAFVRLVQRLVPRLMALPGSLEPPPEPAPTESKGRVGPRRGADLNLRLAGLRHSRRRDAIAVRSHYDVGNDFYALWLDRRMVYSCAYFKTGTETLDEAQEAKLEFICRKLRLRPGETLLDIGCGWGGLVMHAAEHYGVNALGITLSEPQAELARKRIAEAGLGDRCRVEVLDYRDVPPKEKFDKIVSVGMFEHVGRKNLPLYFEQTLRHLAPGGLFLNHGIVDLAARPAGAASRLAAKMWRSGSFIEKYVFPDGELVAPGDVIRFAEDAGFETRDVESLREHYALTLRHWVRRLESRHDEAVRMVGEATYRVWRLYMAGCAHGFARGSLGIVQTLFSKPREDGATVLPPTRADLYDAGPRRQDARRQDAGLNTGA